MAYTNSEHRLPVLLTLADGRSSWASALWPTEDRTGMILSPRIDCSSLRIRQSKPGYTTDWHVAGEPVLIMVQQGTLRISLHDGERRDFGAGDAFIAADQLTDDVAFDPELHGHTAKVVSGTTLQAIHIKLDGFQV